MSFDRSDAATIGMHQKKERIGTMKWALQVSTRSLSWLSAIWFCLCASLVTKHNELITLFIAFVTRLQMSNVGSTVVNCVLNAVCRSYSHLGEALCTTRTSCLVPFDHKLWSWSGPFRSQSIILNPYCNTYKASFSQEQHLVVGR